ncbi:hypothetical protein AOQ73_06080 [Bradyrhizobium pachyrhizi]|uniref:hypothetical protein n=1 Tax=Bradyrhizobium pachyrhizi TaxID=280333 RepID=UPI0007052DFF|nr:hypothetical protein [Bradyrhizobium pachyrhizi]KRQ11641.1 hypothetical protein AOQ73_06080 [Bradyrhizobium pachyrhizi]
MRAYRWGDDDRYWGPFTYSPKGKSYNPLAFLLTSAGDEDSRNGCALRIGAFGRSLIIALPPIVRPWRQKVYPSWDAETVKRLGRDWYWDIDRREFGWNYSDGHLSIKYGRSTHDSSTDKSWGCFLPWTQWRHVRYSLYDLAGAHFWTQVERKRRYADGIWGKIWEERRAAESACPSATFLFYDFDGELISAETRIDEREWRFGSGWFKWLSLFRKPKVQRSLDIQFSRETGRRKGSWKGGTTGHSIEMLPGELHAAAFARYCAQHEMTLVVK